jgi:hypothetical protein
MKKRFRFTDLQLALLDEISRHMEFMQKYLNTEEAINVKYFAMGDNLMYDEIERDILKSVRIKWIKYKKG